MASSEPASESRAVDVLVVNHRAFLKYLEGRVSDRALGGRHLQDAFVKVMGRPEQVPADQALVPWFYRTLRNAAIDRFRRREAAGRAAEFFVRELETQIFRARAALKKRLAESCGTCAEHGCRDSSCRTRVGDPQNRLPSRS